MQTPVYSETVISVILFWVLSILGVAGGVGMVTHRNPIYSLLFLILNFFCIGGLFLTLQSEFLAVIQIIVYAGAIMVLFLFVIMLLNLGRDADHMESYDWRKGLAFLLGLAFLGELLVAFSFVRDFQVNEVDLFKFGKVEPIGRLLMTDYLFPFEMISLILLAALIGAVIIAKKHRKTAA